jgi:Ribbon-helix-helix protein
MRRGRKPKSITKRQLQVLSARVNIELYEIVEDFAARQDLSVSQILRKAVREYIDNQKNLKVA